MKMTKDNRASIDLRKEWIQQIKTATACRVLLSSVTPQKVKYPTSDVYTKHSTVGGVTAEYAKFPSLLIGFILQGMGWMAACIYIPLIQVIFSCVVLIFVCIFINLDVNSWWNISVSSPLAYLFNVLAVHTNYQFHKIVADFLGQRTSAEAQFDESSQEGTRKKIKGHSREEFLRKSMYACCKT